MTHRQIRHLTYCLESGESVFWVTDDVMKKVFAVGRKEDEPCEVGFLANGNYIALANTDAEDFFVVKPLFG